MAGNHEHRLSRLEADMEDVRSTLYGCNEAPGLRIEVDRLTQSRLSAADRRAVYVGPIISGLIVAAAGAAASGVAAWLMK